MSKPTFNLDKFLARVRGEDGGLHARLKRFDAQLERAKRAFEHDDTVQTRADVIRAADLLATAGHDAAMSGVRLVAVAKISKLVLLSTDEELRRSNKKVRRLCALIDEWAKPDDFDGTC